MSPEIEAAEEDTGERALAGLERQAQDRLEGALDAAEGIVLDMAAVEQVQDRIEAAEGIVAGALELRQRTRAVLVP